jgi:hypothetical protein
MSNNIFLEKQITSLTIHKKARISFYIVQTATIKNIFIDEKFSNLDEIIIFNNLKTSITVNTGKINMHSTFHTPSSGSEYVILHSSSQIHLRRFSTVWAISLE